MVAWYICKQSCDINQNCCRKLVVRGLSNLFSRSRSKFIVIYWPKCFAKILVIIDFYYCATSDPHTNEYN